jgi:hypothetical protein
MEHLGYDMYLGLDILGQIPGRMNLQQRRLEMDDGSMRSFRRMGERATNIAAIDKSQEEEWKEGRTLSKVKEEWLEKKIEEMLDTDLIEPAESEWCSLVVLLPKKDGTLRLCIDYRRVNEMIERDSYPLSQIDDIMENIGM